MNVTFDDEVKTILIPGPTEPRVKGSTETLSNAVITINNTIKHVFKHMGNTILREPDRYYLLREIIEPNVKTILETDFDCIITDVLDIPNIPRVGYHNVIVDFFKTLTSEFSKQKKTYMIGKEPKTPEFMNSNILYFFLLPTTEPSRFRIENGIRLLDNRFRLILSH